ncbi:hypothetical protein LTR53_011569 [Teratosphaeriaceae sp. CCFEE 6253]|nr:hypothetical protein LTR53_011569 [Teratosphaeriaceae sp. CCFEE 6253]
MPIKATFPQNWFTDEAGSSSASSSSDQDAGPSVRGTRKTAKDIPDGTVPEEQADEDGDLDLTENLTRKNSFEVVMEAAQSAEAAPSGKSVLPATLTSTARLTRQENNAHVQRRPLPAPHAAQRPLSSELIELHNLPRFTRPSRWSRDGPTTPPPAHLPRRCARHALARHRRDRARNMPSKFYASSGVAYTTPAAFFAPDRQELDRVHPALRRQSTFTRVGPGAFEQRRVQPSLERHVPAAASRQRVEERCPRQFARFEHPREAPKPPHRHKVRAAGHGELAESAAAGVHPQCTVQRPPAQLPEMQKDADHRALPRRVCGIQDGDAIPSMSNVGAAVMRDGLETDRHRVGARRRRPNAVAARPSPLSSSGKRHRPTVSPLSQPAIRQTPPAARTIFIQTEDTPNADALKFRPNHDILPDNFPSSFLEYLSPRSTLAPPHPSPLAAQLLNVDGVTSVFYGKDYITVTKDSSTPWPHVKPEVFSLISEAVTTGQPIVNTVENKTGEDGQGSSNSEAQASYDPADEEVVGMIQELLETRIRPAIQEDGGDIEFRGFHEGQVMLKLRGACRTCDSSTVTLKNGIESMLMHYIEEVKGVQQVLDQEEEVAMKEFAKFEEKLRAQKGPNAAPSTIGKGSLDTAEA